MKNSNPTKTVNHQEPNLRDKIEELQLENSKVIQEGNAKADTEWQVQHSEILPPIEPRQQTLTQSIQL